MPSSRTEQRPLFLPGAGVALVWRRQMRGRALRVDLLWAALILIGLLALAWGLQRVWLQGGTVGGLAQGTMRRWEITCATGAALLLPVLAAFWGTGCVPSSAEAEATQSMLLTHLRPFEIVMGRLLATLWPILLALALSCGFWLLAQAIYHLSGGCVSIIDLHLLLLSAVYMIGAISALCTVRRRPGRAWERGVSMALACMAGCTLAVLLVNPLIRRMNDPARLIEAALLINPVAGATSTLQLDLLRTRWIYERSDAPEYEFAYPPPWATTCLLCSIGLIAQGGAALRLRHAFARN